MVEGLATGLPGRQCGTYILMAWSKDETPVQEALQMLVTSDGDVPVAEGPGWFVADVTGVADTGDGEVVEPASMDLKELADNLGATFTTY